MTHSEFKAALAVFGYTERDQPTMAQVKKRQRELARRCHPDVTADSDDGKRMAKINAATAVMLEYLSSYRFSFSEDEFYRQNPEELLRRQFSNDPVWGAS